MNRQKIQVFVLASVILICSIMTITDAASSKVLPLNEALLRQTGKQDSRGEACSCYALAYCRTILDGKSHKFSEYNQNGDTEFNVTCVWSIGGYYSVTADSKKEVLKACYESINHNRPLIIHVQTKYSQHWVTVVGYEDVGDADKMTEKNLLIIDPLYGYEGKPSENTYSLYDNRYITTDKGSAAEVTATKEPDKDDEKKYLLTGDADGNGIVDAADALAVLKHSAKVEQIPFEAFKVADVNASELIDASDALDILKYSAKIIDHFEADLLNRSDAANTVLLSRLTGCSL